MSDDINVIATSRSVKGKGASRRLRRDNLVPAIIYGDSKEPQSIQLKHNEVQKHLESAAFYSQLLMVSIDGGEPVRSVLRDVHRHPYKQQILHLDFMRVIAGAELQVNVPLHFINEDVCVGVKTGGGMIIHNENEVTIACLPRNIPASIEVDMAAIEIGGAVHLSELKLSEGVRLVELNEAGDDSDRSVAAVNAPRVEAEPEDIEDAAPDSAEGGDKPADAGEASED